MFSSVTKLSQVLDMVQILVTPRNTPVWYCWQFFLGNKLSILLAVVLTPWVAVGPAFRPGSGSLGVSLCAIHAVIMAVDIGLNTFWIGSRKDVISLLLQEREIVEHVERQATPEQKEVMAKTARGIARWMTVPWLTAYILAVLFALAPWLLGELSLPGYPDPPGTTSLMIGSIAQFFLCMSVGAGVTCTLAVNDAWAGCVAGTLRVIGMQLEAAHGYDEVVALVRTHTRLLRVAASMRDLMEHVMLATLSAYFAGSLMSAANFVLDRNRDIHLLGIVPVNLANLLQAARFGEQMRNSESAAALGAYFGNWLQEDLRTRKLRLVVLSQSTRYIGIRVHLVGSVSMRTFAKFIRTWYSYLNLMHKSQST